MDNYSNNTKNSLPFYVNWETTNRCNMGCGFCFLGENPEGTIKDIDTEGMKTIIDNLAVNGVRLLNYAGGEPLLRKDIVELVRYGKASGLATILSTNGILLTKEIIKDLDSILDWVSLPIDGHNAETHDSVRGRKGHFNHVIGLLDMIKQYNIKIKINTMLCKNNINYAWQIAGLLDDYPIKKWKLFQFSARGKAKDIADNYAISETEFLSSEKTIGKHDFDIIYSSNNLRNNAYFLIGANGNVAIPADYEYIYIGKILPQIIPLTGILDYKKNGENAQISYGEK